MKEIITGTFKAEMIQVIAKYYPFRLEEIEAAFEDIGSIDETVRLASMACTTALPLHGIRTAVALAHNANQNTHNNKIQADGTTDPKNTDTIAAA